MYLSEKILYWHKWKFFNFNSWKKITNKKIFFLNASLHLDIRPTLYTLKRKVSVNIQIVYYIVVVHGEFSSLVGFELVLSLSASSETQIGHNVYEIMQWLVTTDD